jgi:CheY-like chemotaxis protein
MAENQSIVIAAKESFIVRVLVGKTKDAGIACEYVPCVINEIYKRLEEATMITLYMDENELPAEDVLHFLLDKVSEKNIQMILIGEQNDLQKLEPLIPDEFVYSVFSRPVDNANYVNTIKDYFTKLRLGEFKKSILVVDDDPNYLGIVREWLKDKYKVFMAGSGLQAIKWLGKNKVDLILLDHEMPVTSGPQVLEMLRSDEETKVIPVMFLTGKGDKESVMKVVALKPEGYFLKTIQKDELLEKLEEFFILHS